MKSEDWILARSIISWIELNIKNDKFIFNMEYEHRIKLNKQSLSCGCCAVNLFDDEFLYYKTHIKKCENYLKSLRKDLSKKGFCIHKDYIDTPKYNEYFSELAYYWPKWFTEFLERKSE